MTNSNQSNQNEIDLFDFMQIIWSRKKIITIFTIIAMFIGSTYVLTSKTTFESSIYYSIYDLPPFYKSSQKEQFEKKVLGDFEMRFYSKEIFSTWKKINKDSVIDYDILGNTKYIDGFIFSKDEDELIATFQRNTKGSFILVKTQSLQLINDFYDYSKFVSNSVKSEFIAKAKSEINNLNTINEETKANYNEQERKYSENVHVQISTQKSNLNRILELKTYIENSDSDNTLMIYPPTIPENVSPRLVLILLMSAIFGATIGIFYTIINNSIQKRKN